MTGTEFAAVIAAIGTLLGVGVAGTLTAIAALRNSNYNAGKVKDLEERVSAAERQAKSAKKRVGFLKRLLLQRESENNRLLARDKKWQEWGDTVGRLINQLQLEVGALHTQSQQRQDHHHGDTQPLPAIPQPPVSSDEARENW
jgi:hypothetical protein